MLEILIAIGAVAVAVTLLSLGVIFQKRTPLKGSCHSIPGGKDGGHSKGVCETCTCGTVAPEKQE